MDGANLKELEARGLVFDISDREGLLKLTSEHSFYVGFDPTASSLTIGNLVPIILALHLTNAGLRPIIVFGGATGSIGDPGGKSLERPLLSREEIDHNIAHQEAQLKAIWERSQLAGPTIVNNFDWTRDVTLLDFLREIGKHFPVNYMIQKETVKTRLEGSGISYTEFSYMLLQGFDFLHLYRNYNCRLQLGGQDQWGNITAGLELIRRKIQGEAFALSTPLVTDAQGKKFGKSEGNAVWLDPALTSPYHFYQFWLNTPDSEVVKLLKLFTFLPLDQISILERAIQTEPGERAAQKALAASVTELVHGMAAARGAEDAARTLFGGELKDLEKDQLLNLFKDAPVTALKSSELEGLDLVTLLSRTVTPSKGEARRLLASGGVYINNERVQTDSIKPFECILPGKDLIVLRSGKKNYHLVHVVS